MSNVVTAVPEASAGGHRQSAPTDEGGRARRLHLHVVNPDARFRCVFPHACEGTCCRNGRPNPAPDEAKRIRENLPKFLPLLRPEARRVVESTGWLTKRRKEGRRTIAVSGGWCVFFNKGCVLHSAGAAEGDKFLYKPYVCSKFPIYPTGKKGEVYVRQHGTRGEAWDLWCLAPDASPDRAVETLRDEIALVERHELGRNRAK